MLAPVPVNLKSLVPSPSHASQIPWMRSMTHKINVKGPEVNLNHCDMDGYTLLAHSRRKETTQGPFPPSIEQRCGLARIVSIHHLLGRTACLDAQCTLSTAGRSVGVGNYEAILWAGAGPLLTQPWAASHRRRRHQQSRRR